MSLVRTTLFLLFLTTVFLGQLPIVRALGRLREETRAVETAGVNLGGLLAGFRGLVTDLLLLKAEADLRRGDTWVLPDDYRLIASLEPRNDELWAFLAYQLAYNVADESQDSRWFWVREGLSLCEEGLAVLPTSAPLHRLRGQIYSRRLRDPAFAFLKRVVEEEEGRPDLDLAVAALSEAARHSDSTLRSRDLFFWAVVEIDRAEERGREGDLAGAFFGYSRARSAIGQMLEDSGASEARDPSFEGINLRAAWARTTLACEALDATREVLSQGDRAAKEDVKRAMVLIEDFRASFVRGAIDREEPGSSEEGGVPVADGVADVEWVADLARQLERLGVSGE